MPRRPGFSAHSSTNPDFNRSANEVKPGARPPRAIYAANGQYRQSAHTLGMHMVNATRSSLWTPPRLPSQGPAQIQSENLIAQDPLSQELDIWSNACEAEKADRAQVTKLIKLCLDNKAIKFHLINLSKLTELPECISQLKSLQNLIIENCPSLVSLPSSIGSLSALKFLKIQECALFQTVPDSIGNLQSLESLFLIKCSAFKNLPVALQNLKNLQHLSIVNCKNWNASSALVSKLPTSCKVDIYTDPVANLPTAEDLGGGWS